MLLKNWFAGKNKRLMTEIGRMKKTAATETENARVNGEKNLPSAVKKIVSYVIME